MVRSHWHSLHANTQASLGFVIGLIEMHLTSDGSWHLRCSEKPSLGATPSSRWLKDQVEYAYFDDDLWALLQHKEWRKRLRDYIVEHKLTDNRWKGLIAAEGFGAIAALLLVA